MSSSDEESIKSVEASSPDASSSSPSHSRKRKTPHDGPSLEIDLDAPEPPSKKALRKLKKQQKAEKKAAKEEKKKRKEEEKSGKKKDKKDKKEKKEKKGKKEEEDSDSGSESGDSSSDESPKSTEEEKKALIEKNKQLLKSKKAAEEDSKAKSKRSNYGIWIGNLSFTTTKADLRAFITCRAGLSDHNITRIHMPEGPRNAAGKAQNKGFAYVDFDKAECVPKVVALSESDFNGRRCLIKDALSFEGRPDKKDGADGSDGKKAGAKPASRKIFVGNLAYDVNKETLEMHFAKCGAVSNIQVATFEDSGKCKGYGWVEFEDIGSAEAAIRGFVKVPEDDSDDEEQEDSDSASSSDSDDEGEKTSKKKNKTKSKKKQVMKKVWVNRLFGRPLRMEFAEDSETRYNKRFGKGAKRRHDEHAAGENGNSDAITEAADGSAAAAFAGREKRQKKASYNTSRYSEQTVQRLTGGIVAAQGKKISFD
ncbi:nucleolar protein 13 [Ascosphaera apis ARSEF 7405]|uniref:Nucleolar protein 13 n=1 Tax=Ascosphaera apis ARSEF 7405 TaxID=392613 RepID=A0A167WJ01_9EURO|nr:nucleolar protein 13 [Ascosphaera apis ARSEF 7405]